jgi:hypothetical protein
MPWIKNSEIETLIEVENYLGTKENWSENTEKIWNVIETLVERRKKFAEKQKKVMREKRSIDKNYGRKK